MKLHLQQKKRSSHSGRLVRFPTEEVWQGTQGAPGTTQKRVGALMRWLGARSDKTLINLARVAQIIGAVSPLVGAAVALAIMKKAYEVNPDIPNPWLSIVLPLGVGLAVNHVIVGASTRMYGL